jgi:hypothetical protein
MWRKPSGTTLGGRRCVRSTHFIHLKMWRRPPVRFPSNMYCNCWHFWLPWLPLWLKSVGCHSGFHLVSPDENLTQITQKGIRCFHQPEVGAKNGLRKRILSSWRALEPVAARQIQIKNRMRFMWFSCGNDSRRLVNLDFDGNLSLWFISYVSIYIYTTSPHCWLRILWIMVKSHFNN